MGFELSVLIVREEDGKGSSGATQEDERHDENHERHSQEDPHDGELGRSGGGFRGESR